jgi:hypothetical protein
LRAGYFTYSETKYILFITQPFVYQIQIFSGKGAEFLWVDNELPKKGCQTYNTSTLKVLRVSLINWVGGHCRSDHCPSQLLLRIYTATIRSKLACGTLILTMITKTKLKKTRINADPTYSNRNRKLDH